MADSCKLHSPASAGPRRGVAMRLKWNMVLARERKGEGEVMERRKEGKRPRANKTKKSRRVMTL